MTQSSSRAFEFNEAFNNINTELLYSDVLKNPTISTSTSSNSQSRLFNRKNIGLKKNNNTSLEKLQLLKNDFQQQDEQQTRQQEQQLRQLQSPNQNQTQYDPNNSLNWSTSSYQNILTPPPIPPTSILHTEESVQQQQTQAQPQRITNPQAEYLNNQLTQYQSYYQSQLLQQQYQYHYQQQLLLQQQQQQQQAISQFTGPQQVPSQQIPTTYQMPVQHGNSPSYGFSALYANNQLQLHYPYVYNYVYYQNPAIFFFTYSTEEAARENAKKTGILTITPVEAQYLMGPALLSNRDIIVFSDNKYEVPNSGPLVVQKAMYNYRRNH